MEMDLSANIILRWNSFLSIKTYIRKIFEDCFLRKVASVTIVFLYTKGEWEILHKHPFNKNVIWFYRVSANGRIYVQNSGILTADLKFNYLYICILQYLNDIWPNILLLTGKRQLVLTTRVKTHKLLQVCKQVVTSLFTSCQQVVFALLVPSLL